MVATREETRHQSPGTTRRHRERAWWAVATVLAGAVLMLCYLRVAGAVAVNSDGGAAVLQAADMLHGNLLLHGWWDADVSFVTTELPEYMAVTAAAGVRPEVVDVCAALTYTLLVLLAAFVARGRARGAEGVMRALLAAVVMLAPQPTTVLLGSPDHVGTAAPLLALLLGLGWAQDSAARARWLVPGCVTVVLGWTLVGDPLTVVVGVVPLTLACLLRAGRVIAARRAAWYESSLAAAAVIAVFAAHVVNSLITEHHGYKLAAPSYHWLTWHRIAADAPMVWPSVLVLFGADYTTVTGARNVAFALAHLAGVALVAAAVAFAAWRLVRPSRSAPRGDLVADVLVLAIMANMAGYLLLVPIDRIYSAHEIGPVAALGAALTGRMLGGPLLRVRARRADSRLRPRLLPLRPALAGRPWRDTPVLLPVLAAGLAGYVLLLGAATAFPPRPPESAQLTAWLRRHHLHGGLAPYWQASSVTLDSGGTITVLPLAHDRKNRLALDAWLADGRLAAPGRHSADFVIVMPQQVIGRKIVVNTFGEPARTYHYGAYTIMVWRKNLLRTLDAAVRPA